MDKGATRYDRHMCGELDTLFDMLRFKHPEWTWVMPRYGGNNTVSLLQGAELLGSITAEITHRGVCTYSIDSPAIRRTLERKNTIDTKDVKRAAKVMEQYFKPKSLAEKLGEAVTTVRSVTNTAFQNGTNNTSRATSKVESPLLSYARANFATFAPYLKNYGVSDGEIAEYLAATEKAPYVDQARKAWYGTSLCVIIESGVYYVCDQNGKVEASYTESELPANYKQVIGMLKLADENTIINGLGVRAGEDKFFVLPSALAEALKEAE